MSANLFFMLFFCFIISRFYLNDFSKTIKLGMSTVVTLGVSFMFFKTTGLVYGSVLASSFILIECFLIKEVTGTQINKFRKERNNLLFDIVINFSLITILYLVYLYKGNAIEPLGFIGDIFSSININCNDIIRFASIALFAIKPCNQIIQTITSAYKIYFKKETQVVNSLEITSDDNELSFVVNEEVVEKNDNKIGRLIGVIERLLILILLMTGLYTLIAVVLTAKTITRYNKISNDKEFAEVYLLGTLLSLLLIISMFYMLYVIDYDIASDWL